LRSSLADHSKECTSAELALTRRDTPAQQPVLSAAEQLPNALF